MARYETKQPLWRGSSFSQAKFDAFKAKYKKGDTYEFKRFATSTSKSFARATDGEKMKGYPVIFKIHPKDSAVDLSDIFARQTARDITRAGTPTENEKEVLVLPSKYRIINAKTINLKNVSNRALLIEMEEL